MNVARLLRALRVWVTAADTAPGDSRPLRERLAVFVGWRGRW